MSELDSLKNQILPLLNNCDPKIHEKYIQNSEKYEQMRPDLEKQIEQLNAIDEQQLEEQRQRSIQQENVKHGNQLNQNLLDDESYRIQYINEQSKEINNQVQNLSEITNVVKDHIDAQHNIVVRVDKTVEEAHKEMVAGNEELEKAQKHQKASRKWMLIILGVIIAIVAILAFIIFVFV